MALRRSHTTAAPSTCRPCEVPAPIAFNVIPLAGQRVDDGAARQRRAEVPDESRKILGLPTSSSRAPASGARVHRAQPGAQPRVRPPLSLKKRSPPRRRGRCRALRHPDPARRDGRDVSLVGRVRRDTTLPTGCRSSSSVTTSEGRRAQRGADRGSTGRYRLTTQPLRLRSVQLREIGMSSFSICFAATSTSMFTCRGHEPPERRHLRGVGITATASCLGRCRRS